MKLRIWIWYHNWGEGSATNLFSNQEDALSAVQVYVQDQYAEGAMDGEECPGDLTEAVDKYFQCHEDEEYYTLDNIELDFPDEFFAPKLAGDEVILNEEECKLITAVLGVTSYEKASDLLTVSMTQAAVLLSRVCKKLQM